MTHSDPHPLKGKSVVLNETTTPDERKLVMPGAIFEIMDWVDRMPGYTGIPWWDTWKEGNWSVYHYAKRIGPMSVNGEDDEVVYGHIGNTGIKLGHLVHASELGEVVNGEISPKTEG